jgi:cell division protein FtsB
LGLIRRICDWFYRARHKLATAAVAALALLLSLHVVFGPNGFLAYQKKKAEYRALEKDIEKIQKENDALAERIKALKTDPATIEKEAREQLRYARPGEVIYTYPNPPPQPAPPVAAQKR